MSKLNQNESRKYKIYSFLKFIIVGGSSAALSALGLHWLIEYGSWSFLNATILVSVLGNIYGFILNRQWVFLATQERPYAQLIRYTMVTAVTVLLSVCFISLLVKGFGLSYIVGSLLTSASFAIINFFTHLVWTFHPLHSSLDESESILKTNPFDANQQTKIDLDSTVQRLVLVTHYFPSHGGGVEQVAWEIAKRWLTDGKTQIYWFASQSDIAPEMHGLFVNPVRAWNGLEKRYGVPFPLWSPFALPKLWVTIREADLVHIHDSLYMGNAIAAIFAWLLGKPLILTQHIGFVPYKSLLLRILLATANRTVARLVMALASEVVFISASVEHYFRSLWHWQCVPHFVPNGVDTELFYLPSNIERELARKQLGLISTRPAWLFVGRFVEKKGLLLLRKMAESSPDADWIFAGQGPLNPQTWNLSNVKVLSGLTRETLRPLYWAADLLVLPSVGEGFPLVVQEAMACGLPTLVDTETAKACPEADLLLLKEKVIGENAAIRWLDRLHKFTQDKTTLSELRQSVGAFARNHWSWARCLKTYKSLAEIRCGKTRKAISNTQQLKKLYVYETHWMQINTRHYRKNCSDILTLCGIFLFSLALYILISPGRIDFIDGQWRFDVAYSLLHNGSVAIVDPALFSWGLPGIDGQRYSIYGPSGSLIATPLLYLATFLSPNNRDLAQFFFAMTSPLMGALTLSTLYKIYRNMGVSSLSSLFWVWVLGFASLFLPLSTSVFDQVQNAYFVLVSFYAAYDANRRNSIWRAALGGAALVILINFKEAYAVLCPGLLWTAGLHWLRRDVIQQIRSSKVIQIFILSGFIGIAGYLLFNLIRFAQPFPPASLKHPPLLGNFFIGLAGLTISPGKGLLWYSPAVLLVVYGWRTFLSIAPTLAQGVLIALGSWTVLIASLTFFGGDWCWGPRYWVPMLPLFFLAAPFFQWRSKSRKTLAMLIIILSFCIQLLAISMDHQRFFFVRGLEPYFWYKNDKLYFKNSALLARFSELSELQSPSQRKIVSAFRPGPYPESLTYTVFGPPPKQLMHSQEWLEEYPVFSLPRPWPIWSLAVQDENVISARNQAIKLILVQSIGGLSLVVFGITRKNVI